MNMEYRKGQIVCYVPVDREPISLPLPRRWLILRITPGRDAKVIERFRFVGVSGYSPNVIRVITRSTGAEARRPHLGRRIVKPMLPGLVFLPDFELDRIGMIRTIDDVEDLLHIGPCLAWMSIDNMQLLRQIEAAYSVPLSKRKYALNQLVRITDGPFAHFVGKIERLDSHGRLKLFIDAVTRGVSVIASETQIEPVIVRKRPKTDRRRASL
jgi:transcription antitermination factor NusG